MVKLFTRGPQNDPALARYPEPMAGLFTLGDARRDIVYEEWAGRLREYAPDLIRMVLDDDLNERDGKDLAVWAPIHALHILALLGPQEAAGPLLECLDWDSDWFEEDLPPVYGAIGGAAIPSLSAYSEDASHGERGRSRAVRSLAAIAGAHPETRDEVVGYLTGLLDRPDADASADEEQLTTSVVSALADLAATSAYDAIERAYAENRVDSQIIGLRDVERSFGILPSLDFSAPPQPHKRPGVRLVLKCQACGRQREHVFRKVYYDLGTLEDKAKAAKYDPVIIPQRVVCPKCGAVDQYELGGMGHIALTASLLASKHPDMAGLLPKDQQVEFITFTTRWGAMHPLEAVERYRQEIRQSPDDVSLHIGFGNVLRMLGRYGEADTEYQRALHLDPSEPEVWVNMAQMAGIQADITTAIHCWTRVQELAALRPADGTQEIYAQAASEALSELREGRIPNPDPTPEETEPVPTSLRSAPTPSLHPKVGRNDLCWCGSGKKYKRCHLASDQKQAGAER